MFSAWLLSYSRIPFALANDGYLPPALVKLHPTRGTPVRTIVIAAIICSAVTFWASLDEESFGLLASLSVLVGGCVIMLEFLTLIVMRRRYPDLVRPFKVPGGEAVPYLLIALPAAVIAIAVYFTTVLDVGWMGGIGYALIALSTGVVAYFVLQGSKRRRGVDKRVDFETGELRG